MFLALCIHACFSQQRPYPGAVSSISQGLYGVQAPTALALVLTWGHSFTLRPLPHSDFLSEFLQPLGSSELGGLCSGPSELQSLLAYFVNLWEDTE